MIAFCTNPMLRGRIVRWMLEWIGYGNLDVVTRTLTAHLERAHIARLRDRPALKAAKATENPLIPEEMP